MKKYLPLLFFVFINGCGNPTDQFIESTSARICGSTFSLNSIAGEQTLSNENISFDESLSMYSIECDERGMLFLGSGNDGSQLIHIQQLSFQINDESRISNLTGYWHELNRTGRRELEEAKTYMDQSESLRELVEEMEERTIKLNDLTKIRYELTQVFGDPQSIRPITWRGENGRFSFSSTDSDWETVYWVSVSLN